MIRYATNPAMAMMIDRIAVNIPDHAEKSSVKVPNRFDCNEYVGIVVGQVSVCSNVSALSNPDPVHWSM